MAELLSMSPILPISGQPGESEPHNIAETGLNTCTSTINGNAESSSAKKLRYRKVVIFAIKCLDICNIPKTKGYISRMNSRLQEHSIW